MQIIQAFVRNGKRDWTFLINNLAITVSKPFRYFEFVTTKKKN